jgi:hypothetical protein
LRDAVSAHAAVERQLLADVARRLSVGDMQQLDDAYRIALAHAPTRAHPVLARHHSAAVGTFRLTALADSIRDALDSRTRPVAASFGRTAADGLTLTRPASLPEPRRADRAIMGMTAGRADSNKS